MRQLKPPKEFQEVQPKILWRPISYIFYCSVCSFYVVYFLEYLEKSRWLILAARDDMAKQGSGLFSSLVARGKNFKTAQHQTF